MDADFTLSEGWPRRILMTCDTVGGVWRYAIDLSDALCRRGHAVTLAAMGPAPTRAQRAEAAAVAGLNFRWRACKLVWMDDPWRDLRDAGDWLLRLADEVRPDLVHANDFGHVALAWRAPVLCVAHSCVASWWRAVHGVVAPARWDRYRAQVRAALDAADLLVAPSGAMAAALAREYGCVRPVRIIPNGLREVAPSSCTKRALIFAAGRLWDEARNLMGLAAVAPRVPWPVCMAGPERAPDGARMSLPGVRQLGVLGPAAMRRWFARASIYALPARYEPFGLSVLQAAGAGCALVLGDIPGLREFWDGAASFVPPDDDEALRDAMLRLIDDDALRVRVGARARRRAMFMTADRMATAYLDVYAALHSSASGRELRGEGIEPLSLRERGALLPPSEGRGTEGDGSLRRRASPRASRDPLPLEGGEYARAFEPPSLGERDERADGKSLSLRERGRGEGEERRLRTAGGSSRRSERAAMDGCTGAPRHGRLLADARDTGPLRESGPSPGASRHPLPEGEGNSADASRSRCARGVRPPRPQGEANGAGASPAPAVAGSAP